MRGVGVIIKLVTTVASVQSKNAIILPNLLITKDRLQKKATKKLYNFYHCAGFKCQLNATYKPLGRES